MKKQRKIDIRPNYYNTQLLVADDFLAEQNYHIKARQRHNLKLHGVGIVKGLEVCYQSDISVTVQPGYAIDGIGREIFLESSEEIDFSEFESGDVVNVILILQEGESTEPIVTNTNTKFIYAVIATTKARTDSSGVLLARVHLDSNKKIKDQAIDYSETQYAGVAPGLVGAVQLAPELRTGWICSAFHSLGVVSDPEGKTVNLPPFKIGPTQAVSPEDKDDNDYGAAGVINIAIPMSIRKITRFRIAGTINKERIELWLMLGGWDPGEKDDKKKHVSRVLIKKTIEARKDGGGFEETYPIADNDAKIDPEYSTLSLWLKCTKRAAISLIGVEFGY